MGNNQSNFANKALQKLAKNENTELLVVPSLNTKEDKPKKEEPKKYANEYEEYIKTWQPGDLIPFLPPGGKFNFCRFHPKEINDGDGFYTIYGKRQSRIEEKDLSSSQEIEYKVLGKKLKDSIDSLLARAARTRGLWVDDKNKLRCPPGSPAANQFTDMSGSNCLIPSPKNAAQSGARAARRVGQAVAQSGAVGERTAQSFDSARATQEQIRELGFDKVQELMAIGGRIVAPYDQAGVSGSMRSLGDVLLRGGPRQTGTANQPKKVGKGRTAPPGTQAFRLGLKEQIYRGKRATELADDLNQRMLNPTSPDGISLPSGRAVGDLRNKNNFVAAMTEVFPNVDKNEFGELFENFIPANLSYIQKLKLKEAYVPFFQALIHNAIVNPEHASWMTQMKIDMDDSSAFRVDMTPFSPSLDSGGRSPSVGSQKFASKFGQSYETGAMHFTMNLNPYSMLEQATGSSPFNKDGRSSGVRDTMQGDMHYVATHEFGHIAHFGGVMNALGFNTANLSRYPDVTQLVPNPSGVGAAQRQPERGVGAWVIDFRQARNPMGSPSIQALIDSATRLQNRNNPGYRNYTRAEVERDLKNFHYGLSEAVENNITDTAEQRDLMLRFAGGEYAASNNVELRAEYFASRRMYADEARPRQGFGRNKPGTNSLDKFADAISTIQGTPYQPADVTRILNEAGDSIYGVNPNNWNISGRMASSTPAPSLKTRAIRNSVNQNNRQTRQQGSGAGRISGRMSGGEIVPRLVPSRVFKEQDTLNDDYFEISNTPGRSESLTALSPLMQSLNTGGPRRPRVQIKPPNQTKISGSMKVFKDKNNDSFGVAESMNPALPDKQIKGTTYIIDGQKIVFDSPWVKYDDPSIKVVKRNPFEIAGLEEKSDRGRELSEKWIYAHSANVGESAREATEIDALLYAGVRGDKEAMGEFDRLSEIGRDSVAAAAQKRKQQNAEYIESYGNNNMKMEGIEDLSVEDLFLVHETSYAPQIDENGDIDLRPLADFDTIDKSGKSIRVPRNTVHFALNHLAGGHMFRQRSEQETDIIIIPLSEMLKENPDALEMLYAIDTSFTPKPGEGLKLKSGKYRVIKGTQDEVNTRARVEDTLKELGAERIIKAESAESSTSGVDSAIFKLADSLDVISGLDSNGPNAQILNYISRQRSGGDSADLRLSPDMISKMSRNARMRLGVSDYWQSSEPVRSIKGAMSGGRQKNETPQFPRQPAYGPMLGNANEIFDGVSSWEEFKSRYDDQEVVFLDYETTGLVFDEFNRSSGNGAPVQIGAVKVKGGQVTDRFNVFVNPNMQKSEWEEWSRNSLKGPNGEPLTDEFLVDKPSIADAHQMLAEFAGPNALMGVQNAAFDKNVLDDALRESGIEWRPGGWIDLKDMAAMALPRYSAENPDGPYKIDRKTGEKVPSSSLKEITKYLGVDLGDKHHNADADAEATAESMRKLIDGAIEKRWSSDVLDSARREQYVEKENRRFDGEVTAFEKELAEYKQTSISGKMASNPKNAMILSGVDRAESGSMVGRNQTRDYYKSVPRRFRWKQETLESSEPQRINNRKRIISDLTEFLQSGGDGERANDFQELTNGLDPRFFDYIRNSDERTLLSDLRQASIEFHSGIDVQPVVSITPSEINDILDSGFKFNKNATPITKIYHADIGIHPETPDELRPVFAQIVHTDTTNDEDRELATIFGKFDEREISSGRRNFKFLDRGLARKNRDSSFGYEEAEVKLRSSVAERTSYGNGSAIHNHIFPVNTLSDEPDAIGRALIDSVGRGDKRDENVIELLYGKFKKNFNSYRTDNGKTRPSAAGRWQERDALILGGIDPEDIEEISIPFNRIDMTNAESPSSMISRLNADGALGFNPEELQILTNIGSGIDAERAIPKNVAVRIDGLFKYNALSLKLENLSRVEQANILKSKADSMAVDLVFTNRFGLNIFNGDAFDARASSSSDSREVLRKKIEKIMKEIVNEMRKVKAELENKK